MLVPPGPVTVMSTVLPAVPAGEVATMDELDPTAKLVAATPPNFTAVAPLKPEPVIVTDVPPAAAPFEGDTAVTVGADAWYVKVSALTTGEVPSGVVTVMLTDPALAAGDTAVTEVAEFTV